MIIKSHIRGGYRSAADYLKNIGENEKTRLVAISDPDAKNLDEAFHNMWTVSCTTKAKKPLHHISINPFKEERLTDKQALKIVERCEKKYGYKSDDHQRVIVEHIKDGRQHFHVMWCRVSLTTGKAVWPGEHWKKSKQAAREMEGELGLKRPVPWCVKRRKAFVARINTAAQIFAFRSAAIKTPKAIRKTASSPKKALAHIKPKPSTKGWPEAAVVAWETWGHKDPVRFFKIWSELASPGFSL